MAYLVAMLHRMSLGVAGPDAAERFGVVVGTLGVFTSLQFAIYLVMQIPAGLLADRFGPRRTLAIGLVLMGVGELLFAFAETMPVGLAARGLVGVGDALTFLNVLRLGQAWFPQSMQLLLASLTGFAGAVGQLVSTVPLEVLLRNLGWTAAFGLLGVVTAIFAAVPLAVVRDRPPDSWPGQRSHGAPADGHDRIVRTLVDAWRRPATREGFFLHMGVMSPYLIVASVWGVPYMVHTQGMSVDAAAGALFWGAVAFVVSGPVLAVVIGPRAGWLRIAALALPAAATAAWAVLVLWPGAVVPPWVLIGAIVVTGVCAGGATLSFEIARRAAPAASSGSAGALVNCGGFSATVIAALLIGRLIGDGDQAVVAVQWAMLPVPGFALLGTLGVAATQAAQRSSNRADKGLDPYLRESS